MVWRGIQRECARWNDKQMKTYNRQILQHCPDESKTQVFKVRENQKWFHQKCASCLEVTMNLLLYNFFMHIIKFLLTEREVCVYREISDPGLLCTDRARRTRFVQKDRDPIFLCAFWASEVNKKFIIWHLLAFVLEKNPRKSWFEMHISSVVHIWSKKTKNINVIPSFPLI